MFFLMQRLREWSIKSCRKLKVQLHPEIIEINGNKYIRIVRIAYEGFNIKAYKTRGVYAHVGYFIDVTVNSLDDFIKQIDHLNVIETGFEERLMKGCHCFAYKFDLDQADDSGDLLFRTLDKANIGYLPIDEIVWVSNATPSLNKFVYEITHDLAHPETGELYTFNKKYSNNIDWVKMPLSLVIERTEEHLNQTERVSESISQVYLMEEQVKKLVRLDIWKLFQLTLKRNREILRKKVMLHD